MYPKALLSLMEELKRLPGIGEKTSERLALFITSEMNKEDVYRMSKSLKDVKNKLHECPISHVITDEDISPLINSEKRNDEILMVLSDSKDVFMMEKMATYNGQYHVLGGLIDFSRGITHESLNIDSLEKRLNSSVKELIVATNGTVEGELTAQYLKSLFEDKEIKITRLAYGLPVGTDLRYADTLTLTKAVENRHKY